MSNELLYKAFNELMHLDITKYMIIDVGLSFSEKFHVWSREKEYLVKITSEKLNYKKYEILKKMYDKGISVVAALKWKYYLEEKLTVLIYDWIPGENLEGILKKSSESEKILYGIKAANLLKEFHSFDVIEMINKIKPYTLFKQYEFYLMFYKITFPFMKEIYVYIKKRKNIWKSCKRVALTHQDFRPANILVYNGKLYLIDFETADFADPYSDFVFCISMQPDYQLLYSNALINTYFDNNIPADFWQWSLFYGLIAIQKYAIWKHRVKQKQVRLQAIHFYELYSSLTSTIPIFWRNNNDTKSNERD